MPKTTEFLQLAQVAGGVGVFDLDLRSRQITGTPLFFELIGLPGDAGPLPREHWLSSIHPGDLESFVDQFAAAGASGGDYDTEYRSLQVDGGVRWLASRGSVLVDGDGEPTHVIGTLTDVTLRKNLESRLRETAESLHIAEMAAGVGTFDYQPGRNLWVSSANYHELLGIDPPSAAHPRDGLLARVHPSDRERVSRAPYETSGPSARYRCEYRILRDDGGVRWIGEKAHVTRDKTGELTRLVGAVVDITELKAAEQALVEARLAAEAASRAKSSFLANVSHEIRTPMNGVIGMAQILADTTLDPAQREYLDIIQSSAKSLLSLINDVLDLSKIEADRLELETVEFDVRDVVYETVAAAALQGAMKGIEMIVDIEADIALTLRGDPGRLRQIIVNLIGNAFKFTHEGHVALRIGSTALEDGRIGVRVEVSDTGIGIPADRLGRLFNTFSQIDSSTTRHYGGSGLGLSIVKRLAELMGGTVGVTSEPGKGSQFWVTLNLERGADIGRDRAVGAGRRILIVDDIGASRASIATKLSIFGYASVAVAGVDAALETLAHDADFHLVLADELMPLKGGRELLKALRADRRLARLPLVLMSLYGSEAPESAGQAPQPDAVVLKPTRGAVLAEIIGRVLSGAAPKAIEAPLAAAPDPAFAGARILLVEDNPVNQRVAQRMLEKLAAQVTLANNGAEALERCVDTRFDAILMDCQMPVMDGFTAARRIREAERARGEKRVPIIALTANVMSEDRERCLAAGMDEHLGKPIESAKLIDCLARHLKKVRDEAPPPVDVAALRELTGGDAEFERELTEIFIASGDQNLRDIRAALRVQDLETIGKRAHTLKGASANIQASSLSAAAADLERAAKAKKFAEVERLVQKLSDRLQAVNAQLRETA
jgi:two-component system sensor histidine kinase/response regulator